MIYIKLNRKEKNCFLVRGRQIIDSATESAKGADVGKKGETFSAYYFIGVVYNGKITILYTTS